MEVIQMAILQVKNLKKVYTTRFGSNHVQALSDVSFSVEEGEYVAIMGELIKKPLALVFIFVKIYLINYHIKYLLNQKSV